MLKKILSDWKKYSQENNILIYQMGKVGSTSLEESIPQSIHLHRLYNINHNHLFYSPRGRSFIYGLLGNLFDAMRRIAIRRRKKIKIITLMRDVYARNTSAFFQNFAFWVMDYSGKVVAESRKENPDFIYEVFENDFDHDYPLTWFDKELTKFTGVNILAHPFDKENGYTRIQQGKYDILVLKLENIDKAKNAIEEFAGIKLVLQNSNISEHKWYGPVYKNFKQNYIPTEAYLDKLYGAEISQHFYTGEELEQFKSKALRKLPFVKNS
jgi:hypothetical protein